VTARKKKPAAPTYSEVMDELAELTEHAHCVLDQCKALGKLIVERERTRFKPAD